jgi:hypothetical protein
LAGFPVQKTFANVKNTFDGTIYGAVSGDLVKLSSLMLSAAEKTDERVFPIEGGLGLLTFLGLL